MPPSTFRYALGSGGFNYDKNISDMNSSCMINESYNLNLMPSSVRSRGGTSIQIRLPEVSPVSSVYWVEIDSDESVILSTTESGKIYKNNIELTRGLGFIGSGSYINWNGTIIINMGGPIPQTWDKVAVTTSDFPSDKMASDWTLDGSYPTSMVTYGKGSSVRAWALGVATRPNSLYFSEPSTGIDPIPDFSTNEVFYISTKDNEPLTGMIAFGDRLIVFSRSQAFVIDDESALTSNWGYTEAQWRGGTISQNSLVAIENDILSMTGDGTIYSITAVMSYGDYKISSITEPAAINEYIEEQTNKTQLPSVHLTYDPTIRAVKCFCSSVLSTKNDMALTYFVDKGIQNGWSIHTNTLFPSGYDARSSTLVDKIKTPYIITGDYKGRIWSLENQFIVDEKNYFNLKITTPWISANDFRSTKRFHRGWLEIINITPIEGTIYFIIKDRPSPKRINILASSTNPNRFGTAKWGKAKFAGPPLRDNTRYNINQIGQSVKQIFTLIPKGATDGDKWGKCKFGSAKFGTDPTPHYQFELISNMLDITPVAARLRI